MLDRVKQIVKADAIASGDEVEYLHRIISEGCRNGVTERFSCIEDYETFVAIYGREIGIFVRDAGHRRAMNIMQVVSLAYEVSALYILNEMDEGQAGERVA